MVDMERSEAPVLLACRCINFARWVRLMPRSLKRLEVLHLGTYLLYQFLVRYVYRSQGTLLWTSENVPKRFALIGSQLAFSKGFLNRHWSLPHSLGKLVLLARISFFIH